MAAMNAPIVKPKGSKKLKDWESRESGWTWSYKTMHEDIVLSVIAHGLIPD